MSTAAAGSSWPNTAEPATKDSTPASAAWAMVASAIPPSIAMIVYAVAADVSIIRMFLAGVLPGLLLLALFSGYIAVWALMNPTKVPPETVRMGFAERLRATAGLIPVLLLIARTPPSVRAVRPAGRAGCR